MKKITKTFLIILLSLVMCMTSLPTFASEAQTDESTGIMPCFSHMNTARFSFSATSNGGYALVTYDGYDSFVRADVSVKVQKRFLWAFWSDVDEWSTSSTDPNAILEHTFDLNGSGTYKATFTLTVTGTDGIVDTITETIESKY